MICFPEPAVQDLRWGRQDLDEIGWLGRSTRPQARAIRKFLNESLVALPAAAAVGVGLAGLFWFLVLWRGRPTPS